MIARADLASEFRLPIMDVPFQASGANDCGSSNRYNTDIFRKETFVKRCVDPIVPSPKKESDAFGSQENNLPNIKWPILAGYVKVVKLRKAVINTTSQAS